MVGHSPRASFFALRSLGGTALFVAFFKTVVIYVICVSSNIIYVICVSSNITVSEPTNVILLARVNVAVPWLVPESMWQCVWNYFAETQYKFMIDEAEEWTESTRPLASLTKYQAVVPLFPTF